jgi:hypothetical protein
MPEWFVQFGLGALLAILGWLITRKLDGIDAKLDRMELRQSTMEKDCVTWSDLEKERLRISDHDRRITVIETTCKQEHGK